MRIDAKGERLYSIDAYKPLEGQVSCDRELEEGGVRLCLKRLGMCEAVIAVVKDRAELISLRLYAREAEDPAGGSLERARELCLKEAELL
ncbi:MAG: hypothetical protein NZ902_00280 [Acidilobaceae archaeon]|nr:hypothetical protein [Acidilobaceae archaeon]MCX8165276.1 hypothetical protein [Acidilobaceae archaeon]MDW7973702.1 hypothetical protein [Sulfolobales archaeon]